MAERFSFDASNLGDVIRLLRRRVRVVNSRLTGELEATDPETYESIYWLATGIGDFLSPFETEDAQVQWALDVLARVPMESGQEIGELVEERRAVLARGPGAKP